MKTKHSYLLSIIFFFICCISLAQKTTAQDSCSLQISLLTCSPGSELYSTFGHSAVRVINAVSGQDVVFNYGTFDFAEPGFYMKFLRGKLLYYLSAENFQNFSEDYRADNRSMTEQILNLSCEDKQSMIAALEKNILPENRAYKYDFFFDNCTTRLRDLIEKGTGRIVTYPRLIGNKTSFRDLINIYLKQNGQYWSKLGIDLLLGSRTDAIMSNRESMFLPDYLMKGLDSAYAGDKKIIRQTSVLFSASGPSPNSEIFNQPLFYSGLLFFIIAILSFNKSERTRSILRNFDGMMFFLIGLLGSIMILMWFGTEHAMCRDNYNIAWAWPTHIIIAFMLGSKRAWVQKYFRLLLLVNILLLAGWMFIPQEQNVALIPIILIMMLRAFKEVSAFKP